MRYLKLIVLAICLCMVSIQVDAGEFDGTTPLLCAVIRVIECPDGGDCTQISPENVGLPRFFVIDFEKNQIQSTKQSGIDKTSPIERMEHVDGKLIVQGAEDGIEGVRDGVGYTLAISEDSGRFVLTASGDQVAFIVFGASTPVP